MQIFAIAFFGLHISPQFPSLSHMIANLFQPINSFLLARKELCNSKIHVPETGGRRKLLSLFFIFKEILDCYAHFFKFG